MTSHLLRRFGRISLRLQAIIVILACCVTFRVDCMEDSHTQVISLKMLDLDLPSLAFVGDTIKLRCLFELETNKLGDKKSSSIREINLSNSNREKTNNNSGSVDKVYSIKWYKNNQEFYRYMAYEYPKKQALPTRGINVDIEHSDHETVSLSNLTLNTSGLFKCEVSTDAPLFLTKSIEKQMDVFLLADRGPVISKSSHLNQQMIKLNSFTELVCLSAKSKPAARLDWIIDENLNLTQMQENNQAQTFFKIETTISSYIPSNRQGVSGQAIGQFPNQYPELSKSSLFLNISFGLLASLSKNQLSQIGIQRAKLSQTNEKNNLRLHSAIQNESFVITVPIKCSASVLHIAMVDVMKLRIQAASHELPKQLIIRGKQQLFHKSSNYSIASQPSASAPNHADDFHVSMYSLFIVTVNLIYSCFTQSTRVSFK